LKFPASLLEVTGVSTSSSIINFWAEQPSSSNSGGTVNFEGVVFTPGYIGSAGNIVNVSFKAKAPGDATVSFANGQILANDGYGTDITKGLGSATYTIQAAAVDSASEEEEEPAGPTPAAPIASSSTHPEQETWYAANDVTFGWTLPSGTTGVNVLADRYPTTNPGTLADGVFSSYTFEDVDEGQWYFHIRFQNANGWGVVSHYGFRIDTAAPENLQLAVDDDGTLTADATDATSGVKEYIVSIDGGEPTAFTSPLTLSGLSAGEHTLLVKAADWAGNEVSESVTFDVEDKEVNENKEVEEVEEVMDVDEDEGRDAWPWLALLVGIGLVWWIVAWRRKKPRGEEDVHKAFERLRRDVRTARRLSPEETALVKKVRRDIDATERRVMEEMSKLQKKQK
jgi:hypothetical protein